MAPRGSATIEKEPEASLAVTAPVIGGALATRATEGAVGQGRGRGKENLDTKDLIIPRLDIVQRTSGVLDPTNDKYIAGAKFADMVNSLTKDNYGNGPVTILSLGLPRKRAVQFEEGGGKVIDRNVPLDYDVENNRYVDPRLNFDGDKRPVATLLYEFAVLVCVNGQYDLAMLTMKGTQIRAAQEFITILNYRRGDTWDGRYTVTSVAKSFPKGPSGQFVIRPAGPSSDEDAAEAEVYFKMLSTKNVAVHEEDQEREPGSDDL